jgi:hypothetical protein
MKHKSLALPRSIRMPRCRYFVTGITALQRYLFTVRVDSQVFQSKPVQVEYLRMKGQGKAGGLPLPEFAMLTSRSLIKHDHDSLASGAVDSTEPEEGESPVEVWSAMLVGWVQQAFEPVRYLHACRAALSSRISNANLAARVCVSGQQEHREREREPVHG